VARGGARREGGLSNQRRRPARCFKGFLWRTVAQRPAWRGSEAHESGVGWSTLGAEERDESRAEWVGVQWKSRAGWERGTSGETWFLLDAKAGIRVAVDKAEHVASETVASVELWFA
jgi:hypothetical protein